MFAEKQLNRLFSQEVGDYYEGIHHTSFTLDLKSLGIENEKYLNESIFELSNTGLLELVILADGGIMEYDKKINSLKDLKYAVLHLDEWEDDWNQDE